MEVRDETEGLEEGAAAQRGDGGIGLDVLATQGWQSVSVSAAALGSVTTLLTALQDRERPRIAVGLHDLDL